MPRPSNSALWCLLASAVDESGPGSPPERSAPDPLPDDSPSSGSPVRRTLRIGAWIVVGIALLWLVAANVFLRTDLARDLANRKPDKVQLSWDSAWSLVPGVVHLRGFELRVRARKATWGLDIDRGWCLVNVPALFAKRVHVPIARVEDAAFRLARTGERDEPAQDRPPQATSADAALADAVPRFPAFEGRPEPERSRSKTPWRWTFSSADVEGVSELWIDAVRYRPDAVGGRVRGAVRVVPRDATTVPRLEFDLPTGSLHLGGESLGRVERLSFDGRIETFQHGSGGDDAQSEPKGMRWLRQLVGVLRGGVADAEIEPLGHYFRGLPVDLAGKGDLDAELHMAYGEIQPGSRIDVEDMDVTVRYGRYQAEGMGRLEARVAEDAVDDPEGTEPHADLELRLGSFELGRVGEEGAHVRGDDLVLTGATPTLDLLDPEPELEARVTIDEADIPDVTYYNSFLPPSSPLTLTSGVGQLDLEARFSTVERRASADVKIRGADVGARWRDVDLQGDVSVVARMPEGSLEAERFEGVTATLELTDARVDGDAVDAREGGAWSMSAQVRDGEIELDRPVRLTASIDATCTDTRPLVAFIGQKSRVVDWFSETLTIRDLDLETGLRIGERIIAFRDLRLTGGDKLEVDGELRFGAADREAVFLLQWGSLSAAVEIDGDERSWELFGSKKWYERRAGGFWSR